MQKGFYHLHRRKRISKKLEPYPHPIKWKRWLDKLIYFVAIAGPLAILPQIFKIWQSKTAAGVSSFYWIFFLFTSLVWLIYGFVHKEKPIIFANLLYLILGFIVLVGIWMYP